MKENAGAEPRTVNGPAWTLERAGAGNSGKRRNHGNGNRLVGRSAAQVSRVEEEKARVG